MRRRLVFIAIVIGLFVDVYDVFGQQLNAAGSILNSESKITIGGYGQIDYNQDFDDTYRLNGKLDVHRLVLLFGYKFTDRTQFVTEVELEHVTEVYVEQAFIDHKIVENHSFRAGLMLVPVGLTNLYHEPTAFLSVERPNVDSKIAPTTWREIGAGFAGIFTDAALKYELFIMNGFSGYTDQGLFRGSDGLRKGRQKGAESFMSSPVLTGRLSHYGLPGLKLGYSTYQGKSQTALFDGLNKSDEIEFKRADSSRIYINMHGFDIQYAYKGLQTKAQFYYVGLHGSEAYNKFTSRDLGDSMIGYYGEIGYDLFSHADSQQKLIPFIRFESYDTHFTTSGSIEDNLAYNRTEYTAGLAWYLHQGAVLKADFQLLGNESKPDYDTRVNFGVGVWF